MPPVGIHRAERGDVLQHHVRRQRSRRDAIGRHRRADAEQADDAARRDRLQRLPDQAGHAGAFHHDVQLQAQVGDRPRVIRRAQLPDQGRFRPRRHPVQDVDVGSVLHPDQGSQQPDGPGSHHQDCGRIPEGPPADGGDMLPRLGRHGGGLQQHPQRAQALIHPHRVVRLDPPALRHEPVDLLDAAFGVAAVGTHVPLADRAVRAGHRIGPADDPHHVLTDRKAARARVDHPAE